MCDVNPDSFLRQSALGEVLNNLRRFGDVALLYLTRGKGKRRDFPLDKCNFGLSHPGENMFTWEQVNGADDIRRHDLVALQSVPREHGLAELLKRGFFAAFRQNALSKCKGEWLDTNLCLV